MPPKGKQTATKKIRGRGKRTNSMRLYVKKLAKENVDSKLQISFPAAEKLELLCDRLIEQITRKAGQVMELKKSRTLNANCVQGAISLEIHPTLAKRCDDAGVAAVLKLTSP
jgi:histone H3/H4